MNTRNILMVAAATVVMTTSAMANSSVQRITHTTISDPDITVYTEKDGSITKAEWMAFQSQKFDQMAANTTGKIYNEKGRAVYKEEWMASQSQKFDEMDSGHVGTISQNDFVAEQAATVQPASGGSDESTSRPQANNQAIPTSNIPGGADGAGGWTGQ